MKIIKNQKISLDQFLKNTHINNSFKSDKNKRKYLNYINILGYFLSVLIILMILMIISSVFPLSNLLIFQIIGFGTVILFLIIIISWGYLFNLKLSNKSYSILLLNDIYKKITGPIDFIDEKKDLLIEIKHFQKLFKNSQKNSPFDYFEYDSIAKLKEKLYSLSLWMELYVQNKTKFIPTKSVIKNDLMHIISGIYYEKNIEEVIRLISSLAMEIDIKPKSPNRIINLLKHKITIVIFIVAFFFIISFIFDFSKTIISTFIVLLFIALITYFINNK